MAHPRSRGEHVKAATYLTPMAGSSPLARGTFNLVVACIVRKRLIPARAGNILLNFSTHVTVPAHPRSRGEHIYTSSVQRH